MDMYSMLRALYDAAGQPYPSSDEEDLDDKPDEMTLDTFLQVLANTDGNSLSPTELKAVVADLIEDRKRAKVPDSLQQLAIKCVLKNRCFFLDRHMTFFLGPEKLFANLGNRTVDMLMAEVVDAEDVDKIEKQCLVLKFLNGQVIELNFDKLRSLDSDAMFFRHLLQNCPKIQKIKVTPSVWKNFDLLPRLCYEDIFVPVASSWKNLNFLSMDSSINCIDYKKDGFLISRQSIVKAICCNLPNLSGLEISIPETEKLTMEDVKHLSRMQHLKFLGLSFDFDLSQNQKDVLIVVHAVGRVPSLERFTGVSSEDYSCFPFLQQYARLYPKKILTLVKFWLSLSHKSSWPSHLSVEELNLFGSDVNFDLRHLPARALRKLDLHNFNRLQVYGLVHLLGGSISHLTIKITLTVDAGLNFHTVLAACPKLEHLDVNSCNGVKEETIGNLTAAHFKNLTYLSIFKEDYFEVDIPLAMVHKKFFLFCQKIFKTFSVESTAAMKGLRWALEENSCLCLDQLEELQVEYSPERADCSNFIPVFALLMKRSPFLKKVTILDGYTKYCPPSWLKELMDNFGVVLVNHYHPDGSLHFEEEYLASRQDYFCESAVEMRMKTFPLKK